MKGTLNITMFGGFKIEHDGKVYVESAARLNKPLELLALLLIGRGTPLSNDQLIERLWEDDEASNPAGALKNAAYSLRKLLAQIDGETEFILTEGGVYRWNYNVKTFVDVWEFEDMQLKLADEDKHFTRKSLIEISRACVNIYLGDFLPALTGRHWVMQQANYFRQLYISNVLRLSGCLLESNSREKQEEVLNICNRAIMTDPLCEELYIRLFTAMQRLGMKKAITNYYLVVSNLFFDQLGVSAPARLRDIYLWASEGYNNNFADICQIQQDLDEVTRDSRPISGAYFCQYEVFKHMFHMVCRNATRRDNAVVLMLVTVADKENMALNKEELIVCMLKLRHIIKDALRKGDVYSRYSRNQYIIMLTVNKIEDCNIINSRIEHNFKLQSPPEGSEIHILTGKPVAIT